MSSKSGSAHTAVMTYIATSQVAGVPYDAYVKVNAAIGTEAPDGLLARYAGEVDDGFAVVAVWATKAQADRFESEQLEPALAQIHGPDRPSGQFTSFDAIDVFVT